MSIHRAHEPCYSAKMDGDVDAIGREARRLNLGLPELLTAVACDALEGLTEVLRPDLAAIRRRLATKLPSEAELIARWLDTEPGARDLVVCH